MRAAPLAGATHPGGLRRLSGLCLPGLGAPVLCAGGGQAAGGGEALLPPVLLLLLLPLILLGLMGGLLQRAERSTCVPV